MVEATAAAENRVEPNNDMAKSKNPLNSKHPIVWLHEVRLLPKKVQSNIARIIWWDWFAAREVQDRWAHLDAYLSLPMIDLNRTETIKYLRKCGYTEQAANKRISDEDGRK
ncbi:hypothetical protein UFOVP917_29 [uncultured Caudovirales phage]|uniref:Uncharacterized protein n=1 Tax=uncultured Caudovirales phage TaxID=2100421 RepID=A0A6J5PHH1_9CAUD|nr:hypothetical protein UFOVP297_7 [uncultured Caudovirales phage]CAB4171269.1 hypothetical protein UFOVP917_29 [uncultured Caudovirales phage]CAB4182918.1 hypothetical protein UFOVP1094_31 [uncultured Caudovirales phage]CAB4200309.1 hypothetical protein UFOVP1342_31 [uncultured Caudovirales phage]CAB4213477.1 hypothetical protein UFOVP1450_27 [uncultured Caudovirales phage]